MSSGGGRAERKRGPALDAKSAAALLDLGRRQLQEGSVADAEATLRRLVAASPKNKEACFMLAEAQRGLHKWHEAALTLRELTSLDRNHAAAHYWLGVVLREGDRRAEAEFAFQDAIVADPRMVEAHVDLGNLQAADRRPAEAEASYRRAIALRPAFAMAHFNLGNLLRESGRLDEAAAAYREAIKQKPDYLEAWYNLGLTESARGQLPAAVAAYEESVRLRPQFAEGFNNLGLALRAAGRDAEAEHAFRRALSVKDFAMPHFNLASLYNDQGKLAEAVAAYKRCVALDPTFVGAQFGLAAVQINGGDFEEAEKNCRRLVEQYPDDRSLQIRTLDALGRLCKAQGRLAEAVALYERVLRLDPEHAEAMAGLCQAKSQMCDWRNRDQEFARLMAITERQLAAGERTALASFDALARPLSPAQHLAIGRSWANDTARQTVGQRERLGFRFERRRRHERIRIGYVSQDFRNQAMGHLTRTLFGLHDRSAFETFGYSVRKYDGSTYGKVISQSFEHFRDIHALSAIDGAKRIHADEIDIMVDLMGFTEGHRMAITALRPAPVTVGFLRYPGSSGAAFVDYLLTDRVVTGPEDQPYYSEQLVFLPNCYQPNDWTQEIDPSPVSRAEFGLPDDAFVFCCFNNHYKFEPFIFGLWMRILQQVAGSLLWLISFNGDMEANLKREAAARGVAAERIVFTKKIGKAQHLARQRLADLFLDTRYYTSHTTGSDALWGGLPVLTCPGDSFAARVTASLLMAAGLPELIVPTFEDYERRAVHLATHPAELKAIREKWAAQRTSCALFDTKRFARNLERAYWLIWDDYLAAGPRRQLFVGEE